MYGVLHATSFDHLSSRLHGAKLFPPQSKKQLRMCACPLGLWVILAPTSRKLTWLFPWDGYTNRLQSTRRTRQIRSKEGGGHCDSRPNFVLQRFLFSTTRQVWYSVHTRRILLRALFTNSDQFQASIRSPEENALWCYLSAAAFLRRSPPSKQNVEREPNLTESVSRQSDARSSQADQLYGNRRSDRASTSWALPAAAAAAVVAVGVGAAAPLAGRDAH